MQPSSSSSSSAAASACTSTVSPGFRLHVPSRSERCVGTGAVQCRHHCRRHLTPACGASCRMPSRRRVSGDTFPTCACCRHPPKHRHMSGCTCVVRPSTTSRSRLTPCAASAAQ
eukprot:scaffold1164_cov65-Phaeocystis_antarctica.AAC.4